MVRGSSPRRPTNKTKACSNAGLCLFIVYGAMVGHLQATNSPTSAACHFSIGCSPEIGENEPSSLSDLKKIGCKSAWPVHILPLFWSTERLLTCKIVKICPRPAEFSLRFFKSDRLLGRSSLEYIEVFYNRIRRHAKMGNRVPAVFAYQFYANSKQDAA